MDTENIIKSELLILFNEGKNEAEAYKEISKSHSSNDVSEKTVSTWFEEFKSEDSSLNDKVASGSNEKLTDEQIIRLINENPDLSLERLARLANCHQTTLRDRIIKLSNRGGEVNYRKKDNTKLTDKQIIDLINNNPDFSILKISKLAKCAECTIHQRVKRLNSNGESVNYQKKDNFKFTDEYLIDLVDKNPDLTMSELAKLAGTSNSTISRRIKQIKSAGKSIRYISKNDPSRRFEASVVPKPRLTNEYLINLINENPDLTIEKLSILANVSYKTMQRRINQINKYSDKVVYRKKDNKKYPDEYLVNLVNENPDLSMENIAVLTGTSRRSVFKRVNRINSDGDGEKVNYRKKETRKLTDGHLINLINNNPDFSMEELAAQVGVSASVISKRIKKIDNDNERTQYVRKRSSSKVKVKVKLTDESLIDLVNENPELNLGELAKLVDVSLSAISKRIRKMNKDGRRVNYVNKSTSKVKS